ncbi:MAG: DUF1059 domain-containing protein [Pseudomonadota bacterium]
MTRRYIDCREFPDSQCSVAISADSESELMEVAVQHAVSVHQHNDTPELRQQLSQLIKEGVPSEYAGSPPRAADVRGGQQRPQA